MLPPAVCWVAWNHRTHHQLYAGRDVLLVLATGGGKSACFQVWTGSTVCAAGEAEQNSAHDILFMLQVPALIKSQAVLVVSPTISLMKDQVSSLSQRGLAACLLGALSMLPETRIHTHYRFVKES